MENSFEFLPTVDLLDYLVPGVLGQKGNLLKAVRLWAILRSLYSDQAIALPGADAWFSNAEWRDAFLQPKIARKTLKQWLFKECSGMNESQWRQNFIKRYGIDGDRLSVLLGEVADQPQTKATPFYPFQVDDRTLRNDFATLEKLGWLQATGITSKRRYCKVRQFPDLPWRVPVEEVTTAHFIPNDLSSVVDHFPQPINGVQRLILDVEYIVPQSVSRQVDELLQTLKQVWQQTPVCPVQMTYRSIRYYDAEFELITYPVCIYYFQRAPYLFAFGQTPQQKSEGTTDAPNWYDFRLDRILSLKSLSWQSAGLPKEWKSSSRSSIQTVPRLFLEKTPAFVEQEVAAALGVEIHRPIEPLLLRFERYFYGNYIANTERAKLFSEMGFEQAEKRFQADSLVASQGLSLLHWFGDRPRHKKSVFCLAQHRLGDNNVVMRLRAWGPNVEVLLPLSLRQRMSDDMQETWKLYGENRHGR